jgi:thiol-disulfide isomerase/thioredoxin
MQIPAASSSLLAPELEEFSSEKQNNNNDSSWIETKDGGFIPNLRRQVLREQRSSQTQNPWITSVHSLEEYKRVVIDESVTTQTLTVVRFYADWCRACQRIEAPFQRLAQHHHRNNVRFIQVPLTKETAFIHQGLGVPSLPFAHVYHPELGLVEERRISKKYFNDFAKVVDQYVQGSCDVYYSDDDNDDVQNVPSAEEL